MQDPQLIHRLYRNQNSLMITKPVHPVNPVPVVAVGTITPRPPKVATGTSTITTANATTITTTTTPPPPKTWWQKLLELFS